MKSKISQINQQLKIYIIRLQDGLKMTKLSQVRSLLFIISW